MQPARLKALLTIAVENRFPITIVGAPGIGKTDIIGQVAKELRYDLIVSHPITADPTDYKGFPFPSQDRTKAEFLPFGDLEALIKADTPTIAFVDDVGQSMPSVQAALMQLVLARRIGNHKVSNHVTFVLATNRRQDRAGVQGLLEPLKSRTTIFELDVSLEDWCDWAITADMPPELIAYLRSNAHALHNFDSKNDMENGPCPRTWAKVGHFYNLCKEKVLLLEFATGSVGKAEATGFVAWLYIYQSLPSIDALLMDPSGTPLPTEVNALYAITVGLSARVKEQEDKINFDKISIVANRLHEQENSEFAALLIKDCLKRCPEIAYTKEFQQMATSDLGKLLQ